MDFVTLKNKYIWKQIYGCPGRYILKHDNKNITIEELLNKKVIVNSFKPDNVQDEVFIAKINDGGIISYKKPDGTFIHTLNTNDGFIKKLNMLKIDLSNIK